MVRSSRGRGAPCPGDHESCIGTSPKISTSSSVPRSAWRTLASVSSGRPLKPGIPPSVAWNRSRKPRGSRFPQLHPDGDAGGGCEACFA